MKRLRHIILPACIFLANLAYSQDYFQQEVNYTIHVRLDDVKHELHASVSMKYVNRSPDTLRFLYMHLWPNAYRDNSTALAKQLLENGNTKFHFAPESYRGRIDSLDFHVDGTKASWTYDSVHADIGRVELPSPLPPGGRAIVSTPFRVRIPKGVFSRLGHIGRQYQITQWYPKPAVYDRNGWHAMPYLNQGEFYSEFGSFDVSITLPKNYVVAATGDLADNDEERKWLERKAGATKALTSFEKGVTPTSDSETKTLRYRQKNVHDFAWFADKTYHVLKGEVTLPNSGRKVDTWVMFTPEEGDLWKEAIAYVNDAVYYYSLWNGDYPYNHATAVDGALSAGGGMEYPNVTVIGNMGSAFMLDLVIAHEVGHNWFYGILGSNERLHPWMDEGINSFNEMRYVATKYPGRTLLGDERYRKIADRFDLAGYAHRTQHEITYLFNARRNMDQPVELPAAGYTQLNYAGVVYGKTALIFRYLMAYLGGETMDRAMQAYFERWKFKHPGPEDLRKVFEEVTGRKLGWFFDDLIKTTGRLDYKIAGASKDGAIVTVRNTGDVAGPFSLSGIVNDSVVATRWYEGFEGSSELAFQPGSYDRIRMDAGLYLPEYSRENNTLRSRGLFRRCEPLRIQILGSLENPDNTQLFYMYTAGWNAHNKTMLGLAFYNGIVPQKKFEFLLAPMYALGTQTAAGGVNLTYSTHPFKELFRTVRYKLNLSSFALDSGDPEPLSYYRIMPEIDFRLAKRDARSPVDQHIRLRSVNVIEENSVYSEASGDYIRFNDHTYYVNELAWRLDSRRAINPWGLAAVYRYGDSDADGDFAKASLEARYRISFRKKKKGVDLRVFAGRFLYSSLPDNSRFGFGMSGNTDYMYDELFLERNRNIGLFAQQFAVNDGGFKNLSEVPHNTDWLNAASIMISLPGTLPLWLYADGGMSATSNGFVYNAGIALRIVPGYFEIFFPLAMTAELNQLDNYGQKIRYTLNLSKLNVFETLRNSSL